jgi:hypothetical protein
MSVPSRTVGKGITWKKVEKSGIGGRTSSEKPMKPQGWDDFLQYIAKEYDIRGKLKEIFFVRFAYEHWRKPDEEIWEMAEAASHETYKKQMTKIYSYFSADKPDGCPELELGSKGPGKFQILREWFKEIKYLEWKRNPPPIAANPAILGDSGLYISRPPIESDCYREITKPGALLRVRSPQQTGKTSLVKKILGEATGYGYSTVYINCQVVEAAMFSGLDRFCRWFCANVSRELGIKPQLDDYWDEELFGSLVSCQTYFQTYLLEQVGRPLVLALDNLDRLFEYGDIAGDFLPLLRFWHEEANNVEIWQNLRLVIAHSTEIYIQLDANQSPFNVGRSITLPGFDRVRVLELANAYGLPQNEETERFAGELLDLVGGHPFLTRLAIEARSRGVENSLENADTQGGIYAAHLRRHWDNLQKQPELMTAMKQVVSSDEGVILEPSVAYKLESTGLVLLEGDRAKPTRELYRRYFREQL